MAPAIFSRDSLAQLFQRFALHRLLLRVELTPAPNRIPRMTFLLFAGVVLGKLGDLRNNQYPFFAETTITGDFHQQRLAPTALLSPTLLSEARRFAELLPSHLPQLYLHRYRGRKGPRPTHAVENNTNLFPRFFSLKNVTDSFFQSEVVVPPRKEL